MSKVFTLLNDLDREFENESDRGCAILTLCLLEEGLAELFSSFLPGGAGDARHFMPRGRLSAGVENAYKLGLLSDVGYKNFKILIEIRNSFAHGILAGMSFSQPKIKEKVDRLELPNMSSVPDVLAQVEGDPRRKFMMIINDLVFTMDWVSGRMNRLEKREVPVWRVDKIPDKK